MYAFNFFNFVFGKRHKHQNVLKSGDKYNDVMMNNMGLNKTNG